ncbi:3-hydroxyacyl-CoA dehydrogenase family protein, partial [Ruminococcaceae bacterium OttesenSCG-928-D13]|nr:3-hydroxyacyl-CoA dehydrogenase family protein [Ruminococcaceae bacterium OttesenSCG-928-D13]
LFPKTYDDLPTVLAESDLIFESVAESMDIKKDINAKIAQYAPADVIIGTGTSGLSITSLAECFEGTQRAQYTGTHFFNPPNVLRLCEVIPTEYTDKAFLAEYTKYLTDIMNRAVVVVKDEAGFLGNRIGFQFMNEALQYAEQYKDKGGVGYIDAIIGPFTGRNMAPIATADFVGLDVHKAIVDNLYDKTNDYAHETFKLPGYVQKLIDAGDLGKKAGKGLYQTVVDAEGNKSRNVYDIVSGSLQPAAKYDLPFAKKMVEALGEGDVDAAMAALKADTTEEGKLCLTFLLKYILYSVVTALEVAETVNDADTAMATGFGWAPPLGVMEALGGAAEVRSLMEKNLDAATLGKLDLGAIFGREFKCAFDYKKFFKAKL